MADRILQIFRMQMRVLVQYLLPGVRALRPRRGQDILVPEDGESLICS